MQSSGKGWGRGSESLAYEVAADDTAWQMPWKSPRMCSHCMMIHQEYGATYK